MEILSALRDTPLPTILVIGGIGLLLLSVLSQVGAWVKVPAERQKAAGIFGSVVLTLGIILYVVPSSAPPGAKPKTKSLSPPQVALSSYFNGTDKEGWTTTDGKVSNPGKGGSGGGVNNGFLKASPLGDNETSYYVAPPRYHGDWSRYSVLKFDLRSSGGKSYTTEYKASNGDVYIANGKMSAQRSLSGRPPADWLTYKIPLRDGLWRFKGGTENIDDILANVTDFQVRAEYGYGDDESGLDNVELEKR